MKKTTTANRLRQIMSEENLKQVDIMRLAEPICKKFKVKIGRNDISQYISGKVEPRQNKIFVLSIALDVNEAWLMGYDVPKERNSSYSDYNNDSTIKENLTLHEQQVINQYRAKPEMQPAVDKLLGVESEDNTTPLDTLKQKPFIAAASGKKIDAEPLDIDTMIEIENMDKLN